MIINNNNIQGQRSEPTTNNPFNGFGFGGGNAGGFHMSFGIGRPLKAHQQYVY